MRSKISIIGEGAGELATELAAGDRAQVTAVGGGRLDDMAGSDVVVLVPGADPEAAGRAVARRAAGAVVLVATDDAEADTQTVLDASLLPRPRVVGVGRGDVAVAAEAIIFGREVALKGAACCRGEMGLDRVATVPVRVGAGGIRAIG